MRDNFPGATNKLFQLGLEQNHKEIQRKQKMHEQGISQQIKYANNRF